MVGAAALIKTRRGLDKNTLRVHTHRLSCTHVTQHAQICIQADAHLGRRVS